MAYWKESLQKVMCVQQRYILGIMGFLGIANAYIMRACLSIAITQMVKQPSTDDFVSDENACPWPDNSNETSTAVKNEGQYDWDENSQGWILSAFYYGYIITHIPGGMLAERFGGKHVMGFGILSTALFSTVTPWVADLGTTAMFILRFLMGIGEGTTFPGMATMLSQWAPKSERSKLSALVFAGVQIGTVVSISLSGVILHYTSWPSVFYIFGGVGIVWFIAWCLLCYNDPASHPYITEEEKEYLKETIGATERNKVGCFRVQFHIILFQDLKGTPWKSILTSAPVWALVIGELGHDFGLFMMVTDLPKYMSDVMHFRIAENGALSALPYLVMWVVSLATAALADHILVNGWIRLTPLRKILATIGAVGPAAGCICASYAGCNKPLVVSFFTIGMGFMGFCYASLRVNSLDISVNYSGTIMAIVNGIGSISGMVAPNLVALFTPHRTLAEWRQVFWIMVLVLLLSNFVFVFFGSGETQHWNEPKENEKNKKPLKNTRF